MNPFAALTDFRASFAAAAPADDPAPYLLADGRIDVTPDNLGDPEHIAAIRAYQRSLRPGAAPRPVAQPEPTR